MLQDPEGELQRGGKETGKAAWVGKLYSVLCPPFQPKAHGTRHLRENGDTDLSSRVWIETSKQLTETVRAGRTVAWDRWDERKGRQA